VQRLELEEVRRGSRDRELLGRGDPDGPDRREATERRRGGGHILLRGSIGTLTRILYASPVPAGLDRRNAFTIRVMMFATGSLAGCRLAKLGEAIRAKAFPCWRFECFAEFGAIREDRRGRRVPGLSP